MRLPWQLPVVLLAALALVSWLAIAGWGRAGDARRELARSEESHKLEVAGIQQALATAIGREAREKAVAGNPVGALAEDVAVIDSKTK